VADGVHRSLALFRGGSAGLGVAGLAHSTMLQSGLRSKAL